jgi:cytochrome b
VPQAGHNPLGGWMVLALLLVLGTQASTGLFATDEVLEAGPLAGWVAPAASLRLSSIHRFLQPLVVALVALHVLAVVAHRVLWGHRLAWAIVSGSKPLADVPDGTPPVHWRAGRAVVIAIALSAALFAVVRAAPAMRWPSGFD